MIYVVVGVDQPAAGVCSGVFHLLRSDYCGNFRSAGLEPGRRAYGQLRGQLLVRGVSGRDRGAGRGATGVWLAVGKSETEEVISSDF